jgi:hypothetical protein
MATGKVHLVILKFTQSKSMLDALRIVLALCAIVSCGVTAGNALIVRQSSTTQSGNASLERATAAVLFANWENPVLKGVAEGGLSIVSLGFAAFAFLYGALLTIKDSPDKSLKKRLRHALYGTAVAVVLATVASILAFASIGEANLVLGRWAIGLALIVLLLLAGMTAYLAVAVYYERG